MIYHVITALKHDGALYLPGTFLDEEGSVYEDLVALGVLQPLPGARDTKEAVAMVAKNAEDARRAEDESKTAEPVDTWGPQSNHPQRSDSAPVPLDRLNLASLQAMASAKNIPVGAETRKQLIALIQQADQNSNQSPSDDELNPTPTDDLQTTDATDAANQVVTNSDETGDNL